MAKKSPTGSLPPAVPLAITPTFRPWTHTSDDSYFYSLVVATATVSYNYTGSWLCQAIFGRLTAEPPLVYTRLTATGLGNLDVLRTRVILITFLSRSVERRRV